MPPEPLPPAVAFDSHDPELAVDPFPAYHELRETGPVAWTSAYGGFWVVTGHAEVVRLARDRTVRTAHRLPDGTVQGVSIPPLGQTGRMVPLELDPPESVPYRKALSGFYSASRIAARAPEIRALAGQSLDAVLADGACDLVDALTLRLPAILTLRDMGVPEDRWRTVEDTLHRALLASPDDLPGARDAAQELCLELVLAMDGPDPTELVTTLRASGVEGRPAADEDIVSMLYLLLLGIDPTSTLTATALWHIAANAPLRERLLRRPEDIPRAVDEFLRWISPVQGTCRTVSQETGIDGVRMRPPERIFLSWAAANRDGCVFAGPDAVDIDRPTARHQAFGHGVHYCAGAAFTRAMATEMLSQVLRRMPDFELAGEVRWFPDLSSFYGVTYLPVAFTPS